MSRLPSPTVKVERDQSNSRRDAAGMSAAGKARGEQTSGRSDEQQEVLGCSNILVSQQKAANLSQTIQSALRDLLRPLLRRPLQGP